MPCSRQSHPLRTPLLTPQIHRTLTQIQNPQTILLLEKARPTTIVVANSILVDIVPGHLVRGVGPGTEIELRSDQFLGPGHHLDGPQPTLPVAQALGQDRPQ